MNTQYEEESGTDRIMDVIVGIVGLGPKIALLIWILLSGGVPLVLQDAMNSGQEQVEATVAAPTEVVAQVAPTDIPATATVEMLELVPVIPPPSIDDAAVLAPGDFSIDPAVLGLVWAAQQVGGAAVDPSNRQPGIPPHLQVDLDGDGAGTATGSFDFNQPQIRILPIAAYLSMLEAAGTPDPSAAFDNLKALLDAQPAGADATVPTPPFFGDLQQTPVGQLSYIDFNGGRGVGYVTRLASAGGPIANDNGLTYVFQGVTDDGLHYLVGSVPLSANFLPDTAADIPADTLSSIEGDVAAYLASVGSQIDDAADSDFTPDLASIRDALGTIAIGAGAGAAAKTGQATDQVPVAELVGTVWQWTGATGLGDSDITVENPQDFEIVFWPDGSYSIRADCNVGGGGYVLDGADLTVNPGISTLAFCGEESLDTPFRDGLFATTGYEFDGDGNLVLALADGGRMVFANGGASELADNGVAQDQTDAADAGLTSTAFQWTGFTAPDGTVTEVPNPEDYVVFLNPDGTFNFTADCNVGGGTYQYNGDGSIAFQTGPMTLAFCGEGSLGDAFIEHLNQTAVYTIDGTTLLIDLFADGGTMTFVQVNQ